MPHVPHVKKRHGNPTASDMAQALPPWLSAVVSSTPKTPVQLAGLTSIASASDIQGLLDQAVEQGVIVDDGTGKYSWAS